MENAASRVSVECSFGVGFGIQHSAFNNYYCLVDFTLVLKMSDEDVVDKMPAVEEECHVPCMKFWKLYEDCAKRIEGDTSGEKHCTGYYFDYWHCNHHCVSHSNSVFAL